MKHTVQVRRHGGTKPRSTQPKIPDEFELPADASHAGCVCIYQREEKRPLIKVPLSEKEFAALWDNSRKVSFRWIADFIALAIREKTASTKQFGANVDLEEAARTAICLIEMFLAKATADAGDELYPGMSSYDPKTVQFICGLQNVCHTVIKELSEAICATSEAETEVAP